MAVNLLNEKEQAKPVLSGGGAAGFGRTVNPKTGNTATNTKPNLPQLTKTETPAAVSAPIASTYQSQPTINEQELEQLRIGTENSKTAYKQAESTYNQALARLKEQEQALQNSRQKIIQAYGGARKSGDPRAQAFAQMLLNAYQENLSGEYAQVYQDYSTAYDAVKAAEEQYNTSANKYNATVAEAKKTYDTWRSGVRSDQAAIQADIAALDEQIKAQEESERAARQAAYEQKQDEKPWYEKLAGYLGGVQDTSLPTGSVSVQNVQDATFGETQYSAEMQALLAQKALLEEELSWSQYFQYADLKNAADFEKQSQYVSTTNGQERSALDIMMGNYSAESSGWDDPLYEYINGNKEAGAYISNAAANGYGADNALGSLYGRTADSKTESQQMTEDEIATFNYLYATQGKEAAHEYYNYLLSDLNYRQRKEEETYWAEEARANPVGASIFSIATSPMKGMSYMGQAFDYMDDGKIDQNAAYNKFSYIPSAIRQTVPENWGPVGSFAYQTGMSMADFLLNTAITGGNEPLSLAIMGTGAAADTTIAAKDRGLNDDQAFALGTVAGAAEILTEKVSLETLLNPNLLAEGTLKYILKNALAEGSEEVGSDLINLIADILISKDQSEWKQSIDAYMADGKTEGEAFGMALADQAETMGLDFLGGAISGGVMGAGGSVAFNDSAKKLGSEINGLNLSEEDVQAFIDTGLESDPETDAYQVAQEMQAKIEAGKTLSDLDMGRLYQANVQAVAEEQENQAKSQATENTTENRTNEIKTAPQSVSVAEQLRREQDQTGGMTYGTETGLRLGAAWEQPGTGNYVPDGSSRRYAGTGTGEQAGGLGTGTANRWSERDADRGREIVDRQNGAKSLPYVSSQELGLQSGTEARNIKVLPREIWDDSLHRAAAQIYEDTGKEVTFVMGRIQIRGADGKTRNVRGVVTPDQVIVQADNTKLSVEKIADHEIYHAKSAELPGLHNRIRQHIIETFSEDEYRNVLEAYVKNLRGVYNVAEAETGEAFEEIMRNIEEEIFADAYAGINAFGAHAEKWTEAVHQKMDELYVGKAKIQENGTKETTGPPAERYSYAGEKAETADLDALARAKEMQAAGVADETIRQQTGWFTGMDGKWRWEIDDSGMQYSRRGDVSFRERNPGYTRYRELLDKSNRYALELSDEAPTESEKAELKRLSEIWRGTFQKPGRITEDALPMNRLSDYLQHDELFEAYPQLRKTTLRFADLPDGVRGQYDPSRDEITLSEGLRNAPEDTVIHEIQHVIQKAEGFTTGSSTEFWDGQQVTKPEYAREVQKAEDAVKEVEARFRQEWTDDINLNLAKQYIELDNRLWGNETDTVEQQELADQMEQIEQIAAESGWEDLFNDYYYAVGQLQMAKERAKWNRRTSVDLYRNTAGEIEARDVAARRKLTADQRRSTAPNLGNADTVFVYDEVIDSLDAEYGMQMGVYHDTDISAEEAENGINQVANMDPVAQITGEEFAKGEKDLITQVEEFFAQHNNSAYNEQLGEVILDRKGVKSDIAHGIGRKKAAAFAAVPNVIEQGRVVDYQKNWKDRGYDTAVVAAPITIGADEYMAAVIMIRSNQTNRFYVHEVMTTKNGAMPFKTGTQKKGDPSGDAPSVFSILDKIWNVKNGGQIQERFSVDDTDSQQTQEQKPDTKKTVKPVAESRPIIAKRDLRNNLNNLFSIPSGQRAELGTMIDSFADRLIKNGELTEEDRKNFFDRMYDSGVMTMPANDYYAEARSYLNDSRIYVPDSVVADFGDDWSDIRRRAFAAGIYLTRYRESGGHSVAGIDVWNGDLASELPGLFNAEETDQRSILERIVHVAEEGKDEHLSLAEYTARLSQQEGISEDEFLDNMERQMDWALRTFAEKAQLETHLRDRTGKKIAEERAKGTERMTRQRAAETQRRARERQDRKEMAQRQRDRKQLQELQQKTLKQLQWLSKNRYRVPEELQATWDEVLGDLDIYAVGAANEMNWSNKYNATWQDLGQMYKDAMKNDPNFLPSKELERIVARLDGTKIEDMDLGALQDLYKAAVGLRTEFYNRNNVISDEQNRLFAEVYTDSKRDIEAAPGGYSGKLADKFLNMDQLTPMNVLQRMAGWDPDSAFYSMAKQLEHGERDIRAYTVKANRMLQDFLTENEDWVKKADGQGKDGTWYKVEIPELLALEVGKLPKFGDTVTVWMTPAQKVHMYLESKNQDNLRHMTGGRTFVDKELYSQGKRQEALSQGKTVRMAPETVKAIVSDLTAEEMELAQLLEQYYNSFATQEINRVSNVLYGYDKAMGKNYAPIYTNQNYTKTEFGVFDVTAEGIGNLKERQYAVNPSYNISAFDAFERHVDRTARFVGMAIPARNWQTLMNWREKNNSTADVITHKWGEEGKNYIEGLITTLQAGDDAKSDTVSAGLNKLQSNYIGAVFGANPSIVLKQLGSIPLAGAYLDARNLPKPAQIANIDRNLIAKYTQDLEWRTMGYSMPETKVLKDNPTTAADVLGKVAGKLNLSQKAKQKMNKGIETIFNGGAITAMDGWAASTLWPWAENKVRREHPELEMGTQAQVDAGESPFYKKVAEEFENAVSRSQSTSDEIHQSRLRKSKNPITKAFTMFRSDSAQTYNTIRQKIGEAQYAIRTGQNGTVIKAAKRAAGAAFMALLLNATWAEAVSFLMALWKNKGKYYRDDEDELTFQSVAGEMVANMLGSFAGTVTFGEELYDFIGGVLVDKTWFGIETAGIEQLNDVLETIMDSGKGMRELVEGGWDILKNDGDLGQYFGDHTGDMLGYVKEVAMATATYLGGVSVNNVEAYLVGALKWISPAMGTAYDDLFSDIGKSDLSKLEGDALVSRLGRILEDRKVEAEDETVEAIAALYEAGFTSAVPSDTPSSVSIDGEKHTLSTYQQQTYETIWGSIVADALDEVVTSESFRKADSKTQEKMLSNLYSYAADQAKAELFDTYELQSSTTDFITAMEKGLTAPEYLAMKVGGANVDDFMELTESGMKADDAYGLVMEISELQPEAGEDKVTDIQKWRECVNFSSNPAIQMSAIYGYMTQNQFTKLEAAYTFDVDPDVFVGYYEIRERFNVDGNSNYTNAEVQAAIDSMTRYHLTTEQKAILWQLATGNKSAKNNPYSTSEGQRLLDYLNEK